LPANMCLIAGAIPAGKRATLCLGGGCLRAGFRRCAR